jgi:hypothetical protein
MNTRTVVSILAIFIALLIITGSGTKKKPITYEELSTAFTGTWINEEYSTDVWKKGKIIIFADGTWERYNRMDIKINVSHCEGKYTISDSWKDVKGDIWFECRWDCFFHGTSGNALMKISNSGNTIEELYTRDIQDKVEEWDPDNKSYLYGIYYRQE